MTENTSSARSGTIRYTQNNSNYCVNVPVSQNAATIDCFLVVYHGNANADTNGSNVSISIGSYQTINGKKGANSEWQANVTGCATLSITSGPGGDDMEIENQSMLIIPSGTTACSGTVTVTNACGKKETFNYSRSAGDVRWSDPAENTTKSVSADGITFTAYADTTGLTASDCNVTQSPSSPYIISTPYGSGTGSKAVKVDITVPSNTSTDSRSWDITIAPK